MQAGRKIAVARATVRLGRHIVDVLKVTRRRAVSLLDVPCSGARPDSRLIVRSAVGPGDGRAPNAACRLSLPWLVTLPEPRRRFLVALRPRPTAGQP